MIKNELPTPEDKKGVKILQFKLDKKKEYKIEEDKEEEEI